MKAFNLVPTYYHYIEKIETNPQVTYTYLGTFITDPIITYTSSGAINCSIKWLTVTGQRYFLVWYTYYVSMSAVLMAMLTLQYTGRL